MWGPCKSCICRCRASHISGEVCYLSPLPSLVFRYLVDGMVHCFCHDVEQGCHLLVNRFLYYPGEHVLQDGELCLHSQFDSIFQHVLHGLEQSSMVQAGGVEVSMLSMIITSGVELTFLDIDLPLVWEPILVQRVVWRVGGSVGESKIFLLGSWARLEWGG